MTADRNDLGEILKQRRRTIPLTLKEISARSGVSASHLARIERGERFPSAPVLRKLARALELNESELLISADYLSPQAPTTESKSLGRVDPYVATVLSQEPVEMQRTVIAILSILKSIARGNDYNTSFAEYAHRRYPELDEDIITMIDDLIKKSSQRT